MAKKRKYLVSVPVKWSLDTVIEARNMEEAKEIADKLDPTEFDNFHFFYEWLGCEWRRLKEDMTIEEFRE